MAYQGFTAPLPIGLQGFSGSRNPSRMQPGHLTATEGLSLEGGVIQKEGGASKLNANALAGAVLAGINWSPLAAANRDVVFLDTGAILRDSGAGTFATTLASGLTAIREPPPVFAEGGGETIGSTRKLFMFSAVNQVKVLAADGASMPNVATPAADWATSFPTFGLQHAARMWAGGNGSDPHRMYASTIASHEVFTGVGSLTFPVFPAEGIAIVGAISFRGVLVVFKFPRGIYIIDTRDPDSANWSVSKLSSAVGTVNHRAIVQIENEIMYMDDSGNIHLLSATNDFGDVNTSNISQIADLRPFIQSEVNLTQMKRVTSVWYAAKRQALFSLPTIGDSDNRLRLAVDFNNPETGPRFIPTQRDENIAMWMRPETDGVRPVATDSAGFVWKLDTLTFSKDGVAYPLRIVTANTDLSFIDQSLKGKRKNGQFLEIISEARGNWNLTVDVFWDDVLHDTMLFDMGVGGAGLGAFVLDTDALTSSAVASNRQRLKGSGRRLRLELSNTGLDQNIILSEFLLGFQAGDERDNKAT